MRRSHDKRDGQWPFTLIRGHSGMPVLRLHLSFLFLFPLAEFPVFVSLLGTFDLFVGS